MKKILWTSVFWLLIIFLFRSYVRLFDSNLWNSVANFFSAEKSTQIVDNTGVSSGSIQEIKNQLLKIETQMNTISQNMENKTPSTDNFLVRKGTAEVSLFYFNNKEDAKLPIEQQVNLNSIMPVKRMISNSKNIIQDTINLLLAWNLSQIEKDNGFVSDFPNKAFRLISMDLSPEWVLTLNFTEVPGFTSGWSARMMILADIITRTAKQFPGVNEVKILPEALFQP